MRNQFKVTKPGASYELPVYEINSTGLNKIDNSLLIDFVKGNKLSEDNPRQEGVIVEDILGMLICHLESVNTGELANRHTSIAITKLQEALMWIEERIKDRESRNVLGTYNK